MPFNLLFFKPLDTSHPVKLIFGDDGAVADGTTIAFAIGLAVTTAFDLDSSEHISFNIALEPPSLSAVLTFDNAVSRGLRASASAPWQKGTPTPRPVAVAHEQAVKLHVPNGDGWEDGTPVNAPTAIRWQQNARLPTQRTTAYQEGTRRPAATRLTRWQEMSRTARPQRMTAWQEATRRPSAPVMTPWQERSRISRPLTVSPWGEGTALYMQIAAPAGGGKPVYADLTARWQEGRLPPPGRHDHTRPEPPVVDPCYVPPFGLNVPLIFDRPWTGSPNLLFICHADDPVYPPATIVVPIKRVYMVLNSATLVRVDGSLQIPTYGMSMSLDVDSWTWTFSASVPGLALADIEPDSDGTPVEVEATVNGVPYRFLVESIQRDRTFGKSALSISGRGKAALLDSPYAPSQNFYNTAERTAQQLMADVLTDNGSPLPWDIDWNLEDWTVPAGVFSQSGSYIAALNAIAAAAGGYIQPHNTAQELSVNLRYPTAPWDWAGLTPDYELPSAVTTRESIAWAEKARYNRVWISGQSQGVLGRVTRTGSAGDLLAPNVTEQLATDAVAVRQRGVAILSDTGRVATVGLRLPVLPETGIIPPGRMVRYTDGGVVRLGITRSVNVDISMPSIWQNLAVETHVL